MTDFSSTDKSPAVKGVNTDGGPGVHGLTSTGSAVVGSVTGGGGRDATAVWGETPAGRSIVGVVSGEGAGVWGDVRTGRAVVGVARDKRATGVWGEATDGSGVVGKDNGGGDGVVGEGRRGVVGRSPTYQGVYGWSEGNAGVVGESRKQYGLYGVSRDARGAGVFAYNEDPAGCAAVFKGRVEVAGGDIVMRGGDLVLTNADCAEDFDIVDADSCEPGTVVVMTEAGALRASRSQYDRTVAGVVSGAGGYRPGVILDRPYRDPHVMTHSDRGARRLPIALLGKVFCKVDASDRPVRVGDLLTTADVPGHAMRAVDRERAFGAVLGKALGSLDGGRGLVPILVALQ
jgi:hypothetical protein